MKPQLKLLIIAALLIGCWCICFLGALVLLLYKNDPVVNNYEDCVKVTGVILESYPPQCIYQGKTFIQKIR